LAARVDARARTWILPLQGHRLWLGGPLLAPVRPNRTAHPSKRLRWRRVAKRWTRIKPFALVTAGEQVWQLRPRPGGEPTWNGASDQTGARPAGTQTTGTEAWHPPPASPTDPSARPTSARLRDALVPMVGALAIGGLMLAFTRNPIFAALPLLAGLGYLGPQLARQRRRASLLDVDGVSLLRAAGGTGPPASSAPGPLALGATASEPDAHATGLRLIPFPLRVGPGETVHIGPDREAATALVRTWLLAEALARRPGALAVHVGRGRARWEWSRWLDPPRPEMTAIVQDASDEAAANGKAAPDQTTAHQTTAHQPTAHYPGAGPRLVIGGVAPPGALTVETHRAGLGTIAARVDGGAHAILLPVGPAGAENLARHLAGRGPTASPVRDILAALPLETTALRWAEPRLVLPVGIDPDGALIHLDLLADGPHLLVAGATGSGKSEFLRGLMMACALACPPDQLAILGIDHKGGATFADLRQLPHLAGVVTDLDAAESDRALVALAAELTRRERILAARDLESIDDLPPPDRPSRLLVVVDEFRALNETIPDATARLERLAAQGRSLGMHLVLATQRPAGAVSAHLRANLASRICFRVATDADSIDVIDSTDAARIDPQAPGTCFIATSGRPRRTLRALLATSPVPARPCHRRWPDRWDAPPSGPVASRELVAGGIAQTATALGLPGAAAPWLPALPEFLTLDDAVTWDERAIGGEPVGGRDGAAGAVADRTDPSTPAVTVGWTDLPSVGRQRPLRLRPADGHALIVGAPRSGRTTAARTVAVSALASGFAVHVASTNPGAFADLDGRGRFGTLVGLDDPRRLGRLLRLLRDGAASGPTVLVVDGAEQLGSTMWPGFDDHPLEALGAAGSDGLWLVTTCLPRHAGGRWSGHFPQRLVLATIDRVEDIAAGLSAPWAGAQRPPGRVVTLIGGQQQMAQLATATRVPATPGPAPTGTAPPRLLPLPDRVDLLPPARPNWIWLGYGGDDAGPVGLELREACPIGVIGPPGSGRTSLLAVIEAQCREIGEDPLVLDAADNPGVWHRIDAALDGGAIVIVDNLDRAGGPPPGLPPTGTLVAAVTTTGACSFSGIGPLLRARPAGIVLGPGAPGSAEAFGVKLAEALDPRRARNPGFGIVVTPKGVIPVQTPFPHPSAGVSPAVTAAFATAGFKPNCLKPL
jgi:S-DNA-T family DNA segregation ATPase FtsK/SpoIIIE